MMLRAYYELAKPRMVYGNVFVALCAFLFASQWHFSLALLAATLVGLALVIASACVFNNFIDRDIDKKMERTKNRPLARGVISGQSTLVYGAALGLAGIFLLYFYVNALAENVALIGFVVYVAAYSPLKHKTNLALYVGAVAGAVPPVVGYAAVTHTLDSTALFLFLFLFIWQIPHFLAIAAYRFDEYEAAGVPLSIKTAPTAQQKRLGRKIFFLSLWILMGGSVLLALTPLL